MKSKETILQKLLRKMYPLIMKLSKKSEKGTKLVNEKRISPSSSFYDLEIEQNDGKKLSFSELKGKKVVLVNTASNCGYTGQYSELQSLYEQEADKVAIIGFPANDFKEQEKGNDSEIAEFCQLNYGVTFPLAKKGPVVPEKGQQPVFKWLTDKNANGWNDHNPDWNFSKYIINEEGVLTHYFGPSISPVEEEFKNALK